MPRRMLFTRLVVIARCNGPAVSLIMFGVPIHVRNSASLRKESPCMRSTMLWSTWRCGVLIAAMVSTFASAGMAAERRVLNVAGGYLGDGGPATNASFAFASAVVRDANGTFYVSDALD